MQMSNTNDVSNGEVGYIKSIESGKITIDFGDKPVVYEKTDMENIEWAYATTVHKSQGSEYESVIFNIQNEHGLMKKRNLLYTAVTRAKKKCVIVGTRAAVIECVDHGMDKEDRRNTLLHHRIIAEYARMNTKRKVS